MTVTLREVAGLGFGKLLCSTFTTGDQKSYLGSEYILLTSTRDYSSGLPLSPLFYQVDQF